MIVAVRTTAPRLESSMKVPPKRKGNCSRYPIRRCAVMLLNESPSEKEGKYSSLASGPKYDQSSMKVPPKRKGNGGGAHASRRFGELLNESPSEKEGKLLGSRSCLGRCVAPQ